MRAGAFVFALVLLSGCAGQKALKRERQDGYAHGVAAEQVNSSVRLRECVDTAEHSVQVADKYRRLLNECQAKGIRKK